MAANIWNNKNDKQTFLQSMMLDGILPRGHHNENGVAVSWYRWALQVHHANNMKRDTHMCSVLVLGFSIITFTSEMSRVLLRTPCSVEMASLHSHKHHSYHHLPATRNILGSKDFCCQKCYILLDKKCSFCKKIAKNANIIKCFHLFCDLASIWMWILRLF